jgi:phosphate transport system substrate-binding protein
MVVAACGSSTAPTGTDIGSGALTGAGATFPAPFYSKAFFDYTAKYPQVTVNYQPVGSGAGIQQFIKQTVDFGASDVPMGATDITNAGGPDTLTQIPTTLGVISIAFNVSGVTSLNLDQDTLAGIFLGHITNWNDPKIAAINLGVTFPNKSITVVHRSDGSGTTFHFTDYMSKISSEWQTSIGKGKLVKWPSMGNFIGATGNANVAQTIITTDGAIGYVELAYVVTNNMHQAAIKNANGKFVTASVAGATAAAAQNTSVSPTNYSITNEPGDTTYPIAAFSWVILRTSYSDANLGRAIVYLFKWLVTDGQSDGTALQYAPLPSPVQQLALNNLKLVKAGGSAVLS